MTQQVGKYQLIRKLATGGMAEVFLAKAAGPMGFEKTLVLKRILPHLAEEPAFVEMFLSEAKLAARLTHPHIVQIFDFGEADGAYFLAMEYIDGPSLRTLVKRASAQGQYLPPAECARLISHACEGLAFAHDFTDPETGEALELIHRDISPDNILLSRQGAVKVVDFGIAKAAGQGTRTESGVIKGKLAYMPPEQLRAEELDRRADVYALGVVLYELLTARRPFTSSTDAGLMQAILFSESVPAVQFRPDLPETLQRILERALAKDREQRYPDCHAFQSDLEDFILSAGRPVVTQQIAQLITQSTSSTNIPVSQPQPSRSSNRSSHTVTPVHTPAPAITSTTVSTYSATATVKTPRPRDTMTLVATPEESSGPATVYSRRPRDPSPPDELETLQPQELVKRWRSRRWELTLVALVLLAAGAGVVLWRTTPEPKPHEATLEAESPPSLPTSPAPALYPLPSSPTPSIDNAGGRAQATASDPSPAELQAELSSPKTPLSNPASPSPKDAATQEQKPTSPNSIAPGPVPPKNARSSRGGGTQKSKRAALASPDPSLNGTLRLRIWPPATVFVDGEELGDTPMEPIALQAGRHTVMLICNKLSKIEERIIEVKPGQPTLLEINFHKE